MVILVDRRTATLVFVQKRSKTIDQFMGNYSVHSLSFLHFICTGVQLVCLVEDVSIHHSIIVYPKSNALSQTIDFSNEFVIMKNKDTISLNISVFMEEYLCLKLLGVLVL